MVALTPTTQALADEFRWFASRCRAPRLRTMREFAEQEIVIPDGPFEGRRFRCDRLPYGCLRGCPYRRISEGDTG